MRSCSLVLFAASFIAGSLNVSAQAAPQLQVAAVPTTKVLAIGRIVQMPDAAKMQTIMPHEVTDTVKLFLNGKIDAWYSRKDERGVVFVMNVGSVDEAHALLEKLPLGVAGVMKFDLIPLGPLGPLNYLLAPEDRLPAAPAK